MPELLVKHCLGWLKHENMQNPEWIQLWINRVKKESDAGHAVVVFSIPSEHEVQITKEIEQLLQERFGR